MYLPGDWNSVAYNLHIPPPPNLTSWTRTPWNLLMCWRLPFLAYCIVAAAAAKSLQSCPTLSDSVRPRRRQPTRLPRPWDSPGKNTGVSCHFLLQCMKVKSESEVAQSCPTLCAVRFCQNWKPCAFPLSLLPDWIQIPFSRALSNLSVFAYLCPHPAYGEKSKDFFYFTNFLIVQLVKNPPAMQETLVQFMGWKDPLEKG